jgi:phage tail-like protein
MVQFSVNAGRLDPYKNFKFRVKWDGRYVAGVSKISGLRRITEVVEHRDGADRSSPRRAPGQSRYEPVVLSRGVTHDPAFEEWANKVWNTGTGAGPEASLKDFRKDILIELLNEAGQVALAWKLYRCWVSEYTAMSELDANSTSAAIESITLVTEGWERDSAVSEPTEPTRGD